MLYLLNVCQYCLGSVGNAESIFSRAVSRDAVTTGVPVIQCSAQPSGAAPGVSMRIEPLSSCLRLSLVPLAYSGRSTLSCSEVADYLDSFLDLQPSLFLIGCRPD